MKRLIAVAICVAVMLSGCGDAKQQQGKADSAVPPQDNTAGAVSASEPTLKGKKLMIFCGAGMKQPFSEIAKAFKEQTGCEPEINFANAAQIQTQINTAQEGDMFIAGAQDELQPIKDMVVSSKPLVKHVPILAVQNGNPKNIKCIADLAQSEVRLLLGDAQATPIGKIGDKVLKDFGITDKVNLLARTTTAPAIITALAADECDAAIVWKENAGEKVMAVDTADMDKYIKTIPAAELCCSANKEALEAFSAFLDTSVAKQIWTDYGYEVLN